MSAKQAINDKLQGKKTKIGEYLAKLLAKTRLSRALYSSFSQAHKVHETTTLLLVTLPNIKRFKKITHALSNKLFLI